MERRSFTTEPLAPVDTARQLSYPHPRYRSAGGNPMAQPQPKPSLTPEEYLAIERQAEIRSEYLDGEMFAMAGGSREHNLIVTNIVRELSLHLKKRPCEV